MTRRLFGSTTVTPSDSLLSLEFGVSASTVGGPTSASIVGGATSSSTNRSAPYLSPD